MRAGEGAARFDAVVFDLDGTLIDTNRMTVPAICSLAAPHGLPVPPKGVIRDAMGLHDSAFYRFIFPDADAARLEALTVDVERREGELGRAIGRGILFPGLRALLERLAAAGVVCCVASTGSHAHVRDMLDIAGVAAFFAEIGCDAPDKADMTGAMLRRVGARRAAFVGDTVVDVEAARANGLPVFGAGFGYVRPAERALFDAVADTPGALAALLLGSGDEYDRNGERA